jgi:hypothetical protein
MKDPINRLAQRERLSQQPDGRARAIADAALEFGRSIFGKLG